jgi:hypothetical protein
MDLIEKLCRENFLLPLILINCIVLNTMHRMRWRAKYTKVDYKHGSTRQKTSFAWCPTYIAGEMVWLEFYEVLQVYIIDEVELELVAGEKNFFAQSRWKDVSKRTL